MGLPNEDSDSFEYENISDMFEIDITIEDVVCSEFDEVLELVKSKLLNKQIMEFAAFVTKRDDGKINLIIEHE